jgi:fructokinase
MIVVSGEALMDVFAVGDTTTGLTLDARIGGSPYNVALGLARLAQPVAFFGGVSSGFLGERLMRSLIEEGIHTGCVQRLDAPTTLSLVGLDAQGVPSYAFMGTGAADRCLQPHRLDTVPQQALAYHFGSYAMVVEPVAGTQRALVEREHRRSVVAYDPNLRLNVEPDVQRWRDTVSWMLPRTTLLKVSDEDLALLNPGQASADFAKQALALGVALVVVTRGAHGVQAWTQQTEVSVASSTTKVVDTVGAGDTFQAAMLTTLAEQGCLSRAGLLALGPAQLHQVLTFAARASAITCSRRGADLPHRPELPHQ